MTTFEDIQDMWNRQGDPEPGSSHPERVILLAEAHSKKIRIKQFWTIGILGISVLFFSWYTLVYVGFQFSWFHAGIALMFLSLLLRVIVEYKSYISFRRINIHADLANYTKGITVFYRNRKKIHYVVTPLMASLYAMGFVLLLPVFKRSFSPAFFWYIVISGWIFLILFTLLLVRQVKKEMRLLDFLKGVN